MKRERGEERNVSCGGGGRGGCNGRGKREKGRELDWEATVGGRVAVRDGRMGLSEPQGTGGWAGVRGRQHKGL